MRNSEYAFTVVELLTALAILAVIILSVGMISSISIGSHEKMRKEAQVYNDIQFGFNLMKHACRHAQTVQVDLSQNTLTFGDITFKENNADFIYTDTNGNHTIISGVNNLAFSFFCRKDAYGNWLADSCSNTSTLFHITLSGEKDKAAFDLYTDISRRN